MENYFQKNQPGYIELIIGCMFSGKTETFIRKMKKFEYANYQIQIFKPHIDNRFNDKQVVSHSNHFIAAQKITTVQELAEQIKPQTKIIGIDELQFFDLAIVNILNKLAYENYIIIANGLDKDFRNVPFPVVSQLMPFAEYITKLSAICAICYKPADRTQRLAKGAPADFHEPIIKIGAAELYQARCRHCHQI